MPRETGSSRVDRLETLVLALAERQLQTESAISSLVEKIEVLVDAQIKTDQQMRDLDKASRERDRILDERIQSLVSAIGEFIRRNGGNH